MGFEFQDCVLDVWVSGLGVLGLRFQGSRRAPLSTVSGFELRFSGFGVRV